MFELESDAGDGAGRRKKKVDYEALHSSFARVPNCDVRTARMLLDLGYRDVDELRGRSPEALLEAMRALHPELGREPLGVLRMLVYFAENDDPDPALLQPWKWV